MGKVFSTTSNSYLYDTGTGKVALLDDNSAPIIMALFDRDISVQEFERIIGCEKTAREIETFLQEEKMLMRPDETRFNDLTPFLSEEGLECQQLIIELTGQCNLRCKYCIYNDDYEMSRAFNEEFISFETAKKAIDYAYKHKSKKFFAIGFYGGEPLLNFKVMRQCLDYCLNNYKDTDTTFSFTTNLTLMTEEIADYLSRIPNLAITVSIDGPAEIQNRNRTFANGAPTFDAVYRGLVNICNAIRKSGSNCQININSVFMPPYTLENFNKINDFFEQLDILPEKSGVSATYPAPGSIPDSFLKNMSETYEDVEWLDWAFKKAIKMDKLPDSPNLYSNVLRKTLSDVHNRRLLSVPSGQYCWNACCIPGNRRLYVCTNGNYKLCEKMGESPFIGHVDTGVNFDAVKKYYISQYEEKSLKDCSNCWAVNMCNVCYCTCYKEDGLDLEQKRAMCISSRESALAGLKLYYEVYERNPKIIEQISKIVRI